MKNLCKLVVLVIMVIAATSCNTKQKELERQQEKAKQEQVRLDSIQKVREAAKEEIFLQAANNLADTPVNFFRHFFKGKGMEMYVGTNEYYILKKGSSVDYSNQDMSFNGILPREVMAINLNGKAWVKTGFMGELNSLDKETVKFEIHKKVTYTREIGSKLVGMYELCVTTPDFEGLHPTLESFYYYINDRDAWGYTPDVAMIWDNIYVMETEDGTVLAFNSDGSLKEDRRDAHARRGNDYDETVVRDFVLAPHYKK